LRLRVTAVALALLALAPFARTAASAGAHPDTLADSTWTDRWTLQNGLDVTVRHIPDANAVAVIIAYHVGRDQDPPTQDGLADLLGEVLLTAPAGNIPERTRTELADLRPRGWNLQVTPRFSLISELVPPARFPGLLREMATRMRGVTVTDSGLVRSRRVVTRELGNRYLGSPELTLIHQVRDLAAGVSDEALVRRAAGRGIQGVTTQQASERLRRLYVPANAVLAVAGNLEGVDLRPLVATLFEGIPGGTAVQEPVSRPFKASARTITRLGLRQPVGVVGVIAPALTDTLHPSFYINSLLIGRFCEQHWGAAPPPLPSRFRYAIFADPQFVQLFPPVAPGETDADQLGIAVQDAIEALAVATLDPTMMSEIRRNQQWVLGGLTTPEFRARVREHSGTLHTLASSMAVRALWGSDEFWATYRRRFLDLRTPGGEVWVSYFQAPDKLVRFLLTPARR
jgi:hypothetical protein